MKIRFVIICFIMLLPKFLHAQHSKYTRIYDEYYDEKPVHFGFLFGFASSNYFLNGDKALLKKDSLAISPRNFGFQVGGLVNFAINNHFELKSGMNIALYEREISFPNSPAIIDQNPLRRESTWFEVPLLIKYKSIRRGNHRMYVIGGLKLATEANVKKKSTALSANTMDLSLEYGFGLERFFQFFKFTPEIRFSHGLNNLYVSPTTPLGSYSNLNFLKSHSVTLVINFE